MSRRMGLSFSFFASVTVAVAQAPPTLPTPRVLPETVMPPESAKLKAEIEGLIKERERLTTTDGAAESKTKTERIQLRIQLLDLVKQLGDKRPAPPPPVPDAKKKDEPPVSQPKVEFITNERDPLRAGLNLFRENRIESAFMKFNNLSPDQFSLEDQVFIKYMIANCQRRMGQFPQAKELYREVSTSKVDPFLAECAVWQLNVINSTLDLESQLEQLRPRKKSVLK